MFNWIVESLKNIGVNIFWWDEKEIRSRILVVIFSLFLFHYTFRRVRVRSWWTLKIKIRYLENYTIAKWQTRCDKKLNFRESSKSLLNIYREFLFLDSWMIKVEVKQKKESCTWLSVNVDASFESEVISSDAWCNIEEAAVNASNIGKDDVSVVHTNANIKPNGN